MTHTTTAGHSSSSGCRGHGVDVLITAIAPTVWGSTYIVTTEFLPSGYPVTVAALRALPAGLLLLAIVRQLPTGVWWWRSFILGILNFTVFWSLLFVSAYRLPGGVAATVGSIQPLVVVVLARVLMDARLKLGGILAALVGIGGVGLLVLAPNAKLDMIGIFAGTGAAVSMAFGTVLSRKWQPPVSALTFTAWQLTAGGLLLAVLALLLEPMLPSPSLQNMAGFLWLGLIGAAATYIIWFRGVSRLEPALVSSLGFLSPLTAVILGWVFLGQFLTLVQILGVLLVLISILTTKRQSLKDRQPGAAPRSPAPRNL
ncbi:EamA family transporter [Ochrobactrum sp. BTU1]|uniref:EamA family transporter n=1 Tax=Ochrobactrum sp. BTU1 TaxID=2840456 RepID=UPI001C043063|nr:DMT family transporter [Ochrobactrum sp. BTU1]